MHHGEKNIYKRIFRKMRKGVAAGAGGAVILIAELFFTKGIISMKKKRLKAAAAAAVFLLIIVIFLPVPLRVDKELEGRRIARNAAEEAVEIGIHGRRFHYLVRKNALNHPSCASYGFAFPPGESGFFFLGAGPVP